MPREYYPLHQIFVDPARGRGGGAGIFISPPLALQFFCTARSWLRAGCALGILSPPSFFLRRVKDLILAGGDMARRGSISESVMLCLGGYCVIFISFSFCGDRLESHNKNGGTETTETFLLKMECVRVGEYILNIKN